MADLVIRAILKDEFAAASRALVNELLAIGSAGTSAGNAMRMGMSSALPTVEAVNESLGRNVAQLRAQAAAYKSPEGAKYLSEQKRLKEEIDRLTGAMKEQEPQVQKTGMQWTDITAKYFMVSQGVRMVSGAIGDLVQNSAKWEMTQKSLEAIEGSAEAASKTIDTLVQAAAAPGLDLMPLQKGYLGFRSLNFEGDRAIHIMKSFGNAIALAGGGGEQFASVNRQILQMLGKGRVLQEDISIIAESLPRIRTLMQDAFGTASVEAIRDSGVSAEEFVNKIVEAADKLPPALDTINNQLDNSATAWSQFKAAIVPDGMVKSGIEGWTNELQALTTIITAVTHPLKTARDLFRDIGAEFDKRGDVSNAQLRRAKEIEQSTGISADYTLYGSGMMSGQGMAQSYAQAQSQLVKATQAQEKALEAAKKQLGKTSLETALQNVRDEWKGRIAEFKVGSEEYKQVIAAELAAEAEVRKRFAPKGLSASDRSFERAASLNVVGGQLADNIGVAGQNVGIKLDEMRRADVDRARKDGEKDEEDYQKNLDKIREKHFEDFNERQLVKFEKYKEEEEKIEKEDARKKVAIRAAIANRFAEGSVEAAMKMFSPLDSMFDRMARRNAEMEDSWTKTFEGIGLSFGAMLAKMAEEYAARAAIFSLLSLVPGMGGAGGLLGGAGSFIFGARASGGAVFPGMTYKRNEDAYGGGGEPFRPSTAGTIMPNRSSTGAGGGGGDTHYHFSPGTSRADAGYIVRAIQQGTKERRRTVSRGI